jgi:hypothetical protein
MATAKQGKTEAADRRAGPAIAAAGELVYQLRKASSKREGDLAKFDKKLSTLRGGAGDAAAKRTLARLERRRETLEEEAELLRTSLGAAEALAGALFELRDELARAGGGAAAYEQLRDQLERVAADNQRLREEMQTKDDVIFELQEVVDLLSVEDAEIDDIDLDDLDAAAVVEVDLDDADIVAEVKTPPVVEPPRDLERIEEQEARLKREAKAKKARDKQARQEAKERARRLKLEAKEREKQAKQQAREKARRDKEERARRAREEKERAAKAAAAKAVPPPAPAAPDEEALELEALDIVTEETVEEPVDVPPPSRGPRHPGLSSYSHVPAKHGARPVGSEVTHFAGLPDGDED